MRERSSRQLRVEGGVLRAHRTDRAERADRESGPEILTSQEARQLLRIGRTKLWELTKSREIPAYRIGTGKASSLRYKKSDLLRWLESNLIRS